MQEADQNGNEVIDSAEKQNCGKEPEQERQNGHSSAVR
jgi:hypothetical protein